MNLVIDIGNTRSKYAFFDGRRLVEAKYQMDELFEDIGKWKEEAGRLDIFLSGSGKIEEGVRLLLRELSDSWLEASPEMELPLQVGYATPETLGFDRIANCVGAMSLYPGTPLLVIDSGTAVTYNYVSEEGVFLGGNISPGLEIRFRGLHQFTVRLPYVHPDKNYGGMGRTTEQAIRNGVMNGMLFEAEGYIQRFVADYENKKVVITGGNSYFWKNLLKEEVVFCDDLGFIGLNEMLMFVKKSN